jgi:hypothetical protein
MNATTSPAIPPQAPPPDAAKVVLIVLPPKGDPLPQVEAVRTAYRARFKQESLVVMPPPACVAL